MRQTIVCRSKCRVGKRDPARAYSIGKLPTQTEAATFRFCSPRQISEVRCPLSCRHLPAHRKQWGNPSVSRPSKWPSPFPHRMSQNRRSSPAALLLLAWWTQAFQPIGHEYKAKLPLRDRRGLGGRLPKSASIPSYEKSLVHSAGLERASARDLVGLYPIELRARHLAG